MSLSEFLGDLLCLLDRKRKKYVFANLNLVFPQMDENEKKNLARKFYRNFVKNFFDFVKHRNITLNELKNIVEFEGLEKIEKYLNKPVIFITAHYGNWEMIPLIMSGIFNIPVTIVVRSLDNKFLNKFFKKTESNLI